MQTKELDSFKLSDAITFHDELNPKLWAGNKLRPEVKMQLQEIAKDFLEEMGIHDLDVIDITVSGSNAAYSYTKHSDLDLHILVNLKDLPNNEVYKELFQAKKTLYNDSHNITIHGVPVELYVQDANEPVVSLGEYSIKNDKWIKIPTKRRANFDQTASRLKYNKLLDIIKLALKSKNLAKVNKILKKIKQYRQAGLDKGGEFGPENLAYKALRSQGYITKLYALRDKLHSEMLTIENMYAQEDYHPNSKPRGPEFKPTMPKGTVKVDVSDVYDWYKLGQHISNMKGLGKHDFGAGPPSTILSFGDEDTEHKYIKDLEKTGLTTTDIDPVDPNQPKGMKRQKVDPTYNVAEGLEQSLSSMVSQDQAERNEYATFVKSQAGGDWSKGAKMYAQLKKRPIDDIFGDAIRLNQFMKMKFDFDKFTNKDWDNYWLLAQHCDNNRDFQKNALSIIKKYQGTDHSHYKYLYDRISMGLTGKQKYGTQNIKEQGVAESNDQSSAKTGIYQSEVYGTKAYHSKCLEKGCDWESRRFDRIKQAQDAAKKHAQTHIKSGVTEDETLQFASEKTPAINPYGGLKDRQYRGSISEAPIIGNYADLYHTAWTDNGALDSILQSGKLVPGQNKWLSLTRDSRLDYAKMMGQFAEFVIDQNKLRQRVKLDQYDDFKGRGDDEAEERVTVPIPLKGYVKSIHLPASWKHDEKARQYYEPKLKQYGIPFYYDTMGSREDRNADVPRLEEASGYIPSEKEKNDPRFKTGLTVDVKPDSIKKNAKSFYWKTSRAGIPPTARADGKF